MIANKNAELQRLTGIYKNVLKNAGVTLIEGRGKVGQHCEFMILALNVTVLLFKYCVFAQKFLIHTRRFISLLTLEIQSCIVLYNELVIQSLSACISTISTDSG